MESWVYIGKDVNVGLCVCFKIIMYKHVNYCMVMLLLLCETLAVSRDGCQTEADEQENHFK